jgi:WD40 repeat protein
MNSTAEEFARRLLADASSDTPQPAVIEAILHLLVNNPGEAISEAILAGLNSLLDRSLVRDASWETWAKYRLPSLASLLVAGGKPASPTSPAAVLSQLALGQYNGSGAMPQDIEALLSAGSDADHAIAERANLTLRSLGNPEAWGELCRVVIETNHPTARAIALDCGYTPLSLPSRALFFILTGQWDRYQALDFDAGLLEAIYAAGSDTLRSQIASLARQTGLASFARVLTGSRLRRISSNLTDFEWEAVLVILNREQRYVDLWRLAQNAPPAWSTRFLHSLHSANWRPQEISEQDDFIQLWKAASACLADDPTSQHAEPLAQHRAVLHGHTRQITALLSLPQYNLLASASAEKYVRMWGLNTDRQTAILEGHTDFVLSLAAPPGANWLASGGADRTVRIWSLPDGGLRQVLGGHSSRVSHLAASPDGQILVSGDEHTIYLWHAGQEFRPLGVIKNQVNGLSQLMVMQEPGGAKAWLVAGDHDRTVRIWSLPTPENPTAEICRTLLTPIVGWAIHQSKAQGVSFLASSSSYGAIQIWSIPGGEVVRSLAGRVNNTMLSFSPDGHWLAVAASQSGRSGAFLWDLTLPDDAQPIFLACGAGLTSALAFHPSSRLVAIASQDRSLRLWSLPGTETPARMVKLLEGHNTPIKHLCFTPPGNALFSADERVIQRWSITSLESVLGIPAAHLQPEQLSALLAEPELSGSQRAWLSFSFELAQRQRRYDIEISEAETLVVGEFDIEIAP